MTETEDTKTGVEHDYEQVDSVEDLPDHPADRVHPGFNPNARTFLKEAVGTIGTRGRYGELRGMVVVASTTVHIYSEDWGVAARSATEKVSDGDLLSSAPNKPREIDEPDEDKLIHEFYYEDDEDWPAFEVDLVGGQRFFLWARDQAQAAEVGVQLVDPGEYGSVAYLTDWRADLDEIDVDRLAVGKRSFEMMLEEARDDD